MPLAVNVLFLHLPEALRVRTAYLLLQKGLHLCVAYMFSVNNVWSILLLLGGTRELLKVLLSTLLIFYLSSAHLCDLVSGLMRATRDNLALAARFGGLVAREEAGASVARPKLQDRAVSTIATRAFKLVGFASEASDST
uniref:Uncharacterized protein n=1 Tax=Favella ehrenbergii TaxID=182087 RepID=A0A7S3MQH5_9SPIT